MERVKIDVCCVMTSSLFSRDRGTQENLGEPRTTQENPEELRRTQDNLREPRRTQENPRELRGTQENSGNLRRTQENSGEPRRVHDLWRGRFWLADPTSWRLHGGRERRGREDGGRVYLADRKSVV